MEEVTTSKRGDRRTKNRAEILMRLEKKGRNVKVRDREGILVWANQR